MKRIVTLLLALAMVLSLVSVNTTSVCAEELNNEVVEYYFQKANEVEVTDTHVIFTDDGSGQVVSIEKDPQNVAILYGSLVCLWYEAGGTVPLTVGGTSAVALYEEQIGRDVTQDEGVKVVTESSSGTAWDVESILAERPDLIITSVGMKGYSTIEGPASAVGIPVIGIDYDGVQDYLKWFKVFCNLSGNAQLWEEVAERTATNIINVVSQVPAEADAPTAVILIYTSNTMKAYTSATLAGQILNELGGVNLVDPDATAEKSSVELSLEELYAMNPDYLFLNWYSTEGEMYEQLMAFVEGNPVWDALSAVKNDKFILLDKGLFFNKANRRYDESYLTMAQILYPDVDFAVESEAEGGLNLTEENGVLTCFDAETSPFEDCAVRVTVDKSEKTVTFVKATYDGQDTLEYYKFMPEENMVEQFYYVSMMGTGFYYYFDTELGEMTRMEDMNHEDSTQSAKENGRFDAPAARIKGEVVALEDYFAANFGMTIAEAIQ